MDPETNRQPTGGQPVMDVQRPAKQLFEAPVALPTPPEVPAPPQPTNPTQTLSSGGDDGSNTKLIIVISICVFIVLVALSVLGFLYLKSKNKPQPTTDTTQQVQDDGKIDPTDIDNVTSEIDNSVKTLNDSQDFSPSELSDSTIGL